MQVTPNDIPDWYVVDTLSLAQYLTKNSSRSVIHIFARKVLLTADVSWLTEVSRYPLDLRIDCDTLYVLGNVTVDCSGSNTAMGWNALGMGNGEKGFPGGSILINAINIEYNDIDSRVTFLANGGIGGKGSDGFPGEFGEDAPPAPPGHLGEPGASGQYGRYGTNGGDGGDGGSITINLGNAPSIQTNLNSITISAKGGAPGAGGAGGKGGAGGAGGTGGAVGIGYGYPGGEGGFGGNGGNGGIGQPGGAAGAGSPGGVGGAGGTGNDGQGPNGLQGMMGQDGIPGVNGGTYGNAGTAKYTILSSAAILEQMLTDPIISGLRIRMHRLISAAVYNFYRGADIDMSTKLMWLKTLAADPTIDFQDVIIRIDVILKDLPLKMSVPTRKSRTISISSAIALLQSFQKIANDNNTQDNPIRGQLMQAHQQAYADRVNYLNSVRSNTTPIVNPKMTFVNSVNARLSAVIAKLQSIQQIAADPAEIELTEFIQELEKEFGIGGDGTSTSGSFAYEDVLADITGDLMLETEAVLFPEGTIATILLSAVFSISIVGLSGLLSGHNSAAEQEYQRAMQQWRYQLSQWEIMEASKQDEWNQMVQANQDQGDKETNVINARQQKEKDEDDLTKTRLKFGSKYIGVLDSWDPVEDGSGNNIATFDCVLLPEISDPLVLATYIAAAYVGFSFIVTVTLTDEVMQKLTPGNWYTMTAGPSGGTDTIDSYVKIVMLGNGTTIDLLWEMPVPYRTTMSEPEDAGKILSALLNQLLKIDQIPNKSSAPAQVSAPETTYSINNVIMQNVGQGACHTMWFNINGAQEMKFIHDVGYGSPKTVADLIGLTTQISTSKATICLSHWDRDHLRLGVLVGSYITTTNVFAGPAYGIMGPTLKSYVESIISAGKNANKVTLYIGGPYLPSFLHSSPYMSAVASFDQIVPLINAPTNVAFRVSQKAETSYDKNNIASISAVVSGAQTKLLLPGDCSYYYIPTDAKTALTHLEATHHGSTNSIMKSSGSGSGTLSDNDIPAYGSQNGCWLLSNGKGNSYHHSAANSCKFYNPKGWGTGGNTFETSTLDQSVSVTIK